MTTAELCTGISARWCPVCGECRCAGDDMDDPRCPLHSVASAHGEDGDVNTKTLLEVMAEVGREVAEASVMDKTAPLAECLDVLRNAAAWAILALHAEEGEGDAGWSAEHERRWKAGEIDRFGRPMAPEEGRGAAAVGVDLGAGPKREGEEGRRSTGELVGVYVCRRDPSCVRSGKSVYRSAIELTDPEKPGAVWCEVCSYELDRVGEAHVVSGAAR